MKLFDAFFVVGVPPSRLIRQARYRSRLNVSERTASRFAVFGGSSEWNKNKDVLMGLRRRSRLRPETLVSFPGSPSEDGSRPRFRDGTTLEGSICDFCFPSGFANAEEDSTDVARSGLPDRERIFFTVNSGALGQVTSAEDAEPVYCVGLRTVETIQLKRLVPEICDLNFLCQVHDKEPTDLLRAEIDSRLQSLMKIASDPSKRDDLVTWRAQYCYVLVSRTPILTWLISAVELFRLLCNIKIEEPRSPSRSPKSQKGLMIDAFNSLLGQMSIGTQPWARRTVTKVGLQPLLEELRNNKVCAGSHRRQSAVIEAYVALLADWIPPVLPVTISLSARALIMLLYFTGPDNVLPVRDFLSSPIFPCDEPERSAAVRLLDPFISPGDNEWVPGALQLWSKLTTDSEQLVKALQIQLLWGSSADRFKLVSDHTLLGLSDVALPIAFDLVPVEALMWLFILVMLEHKVIVSGGSSSARSSLIFLLRASCAPFKWPHAFIPIMPSSVGIEILDSPVPFLAAVRKIPSDYQSIVLPETAQVGAERGRNSSGAAKSKRGRSRVEVLTAHHCNRCGAHAMDLVRTAKATSPCRWHLHREISSSLVAALRKIEDDSRDGSWTVSRGNASMEANGSPSLASSPFLTLESMVEIMDSPCTGSGGSSNELYAPSLHQGTTHAREFGYQSCESIRPISPPTCCDVSQLFTEVSLRPHQLRAKELRWKLGFTRWDGGVLILSSDSEPHNTPTVQVPTRLLDLFSGGGGNDSQELPVTHPSTPNSESSLGFENINLRTARSSQAGRDHYSPWSTLFDIRRMAAVNRAAYADDMHFVLLHHLRYHLPYYWHISSTPVRKWTQARKSFWISDIVHRLAAKPFVSMRGSARPYLVPAFLTFAAAASSKLQTRSKSVFTLLKKHIRRSRLGVGLLRPIVVAAAEDETSSLSSSTSSSEDTQLSSIIQEMSLHISSLEADILTGMHDLRTLQSLTSVACLCAWQCRVTWPIRLICLLFNFWKADQNRVSESLLRSKEDHKLRHVTAPARRRRRSAPCAFRPSVTQLCSSVRRHSVLCGPPRSCQRPFRDSLDEDSNLNQSSSEQPQLTYGASTPMPMFGPFSALSWSSSTTSSSPTLMWSPRGGNLGNNTLLECYSTRSALWDDRRPLRPPSPQRRQSPAEDTESCVTPHRRDSTMFPPESSKSLDLRNEALQWNYFVHHILFRSVFEAWVIQNRERVLRGTEAKISSVWDNVDQSTNVTGCTCCCVGGNECSVEFELVRRAAQAFVRLQSKSLDKSAYSLASLSLFAKKRAGPNDRKMSACGRTKRKLVGLCDDALKFVSADSNEAVDVKELKEELKKDLHVVVDAQIRLIQEAQNIENQLVDAASTSDKEVSLLMDKAKNCLAQLLLGNDSLSDRGIEDSSIEGVDDWLSEWAQMSVKLSQWKIVLQQAFSSQMVQTLVSSQ